MGAAHRGKRPKGYIDNWQPQAKTVRLIAQVQEILNDYRAFLPMTARQVFYRLVGAYDYDKTEQAYARLCEALVKARRAQIIPFSSIRDDGTAVHYAGGWDSTNEWWRSVVPSARAYGRDRAAFQDVRVELWCEAAGMAPQLARVARDYGISVYSTGGFSSVTVTHEIADRVLTHERPTIFMHVGDYDPSGESIFEAMTEDVTEFVAHEIGYAEELFVPRRVALTAAQVNEYDLPTAPPKRSDTRSRNWFGATCQAEAMDPQTLSTVVREAIENAYDTDILDRIVREEAQEREALVAEVTEIVENRSK